MEVRPRARMTSAVVAGLLAGYGIAVPVGAVSVYLLTLSARSRWRTAAAAALGVATVDGLYAAVAVVGGSALAHAVQPVAGVCRAVSALVLLCIAGLTVLSGLGHHRVQRCDSDDRPQPAPTSARSGYAVLFGMTCVNPTTVTYFVAVIVGGDASSTTGVSGRAMFVVSAFAASASWQLLLASAGRLLGRIFRGSRGRLVTATASASIIAALAVGMLA